MFDRLSLVEPGDPARLELRERLEAVGVRYVLDRDASAACNSLVRTAENLFDPASPLFRMPTKCFWFEAFPDIGPESLGGDGLRLGALISCDDGGRAGIVEHFAEQPDGLCDRLPMVTHFNLDGRPRPGAFPRFWPTPAAFPHLATLLSCTASELDQSARQRLAGNPQGLAAYQRSLAEATWFDVPVIMAFLALLNSPGIVESRESSLDRLNRARARRGRRPLLDHIEVRLVLGSSAAHGEGGNGARRLPPRLHYVRGHFMQRAGKTVWRSPHLRGDDSRAIVTRTVRVTAPRDRRLVG